MIQVVADSTLLRYLIEIEVMDVLPVLFEQIIAPPAVIHDLQHINTPVLSARGLRPRLPGS